MPNPYLLLAALLLFTACATDPTTLDEPEVTTNEETDTDTEEETAPTEVLDLVNAQRRTGCVCGATPYPAAPPLDLHPALTAAAALHATDQADHNNMSHTGSDGSTMGQRLSRQGYRWRTVGENVARGYRSEAAVVAGWFASEGHCRNMMNENYRHLGYGRDRGFFTMLLAAPR